MAASATWQHLPAPTQYASPTHNLAPRITPSPGCCDQEPNEVVVLISTTFVITDYSRFYNTPINSFEPSYLALSDGSFITPPFQHDLASSNISLLVSAMLVMLFVRNIMVAIDYLRRASMKRKLLLRLLLASQVLSIGLVPLLASYFTSRLDCTSVTLLATATTGISLAVLMTGVLGLKAYRCLDSSRLVLVVLFAFFSASSTFLLLQLSSTNGSRRLTGGCSTVLEKPQFMRSYGLIQLAHSLFICCCFLHAVWSSRSSPAARGRMSLRLTLEDVTVEKLPRGPWWKQVLERNNTPVTVPSLDVTSVGDKDESVAPPAIPTPSADDTASIRRRSSVSGVVAHDLDSLTEHPEEPILRHRGSNSRSSWRSSIPFSRIIPRMELFHQVMKDELMYTTVITVAAVVLALLLVFGVNFENDLDLTGWTGANWAIISVLVLHSSGRVVSRHEREALVQHPSAWQWNDRDRSPYSRRTPRVPPLEDPFSDARAIRRNSYTSWNSDFSDSPSSPSPAATIRDRRSSHPSPFREISHNRHTLVDVPEKSSLT